jgi:hypothetical protein
MITVAFVAAINLSGIASVSDQVTVNSAGTNQNVTGEDSNTV